jgi:hypothetical protein
MGAVHIRLQDLPVGGGASATMGRADGATATAVTSTPRVPTRTTTHCTMPGAGEADNHIRRRHGDPLCAGLRRTRLML